MALSRDEILEEIDTTTMPDLMTRAEALAWLEDMIAELESQCAALREEVAHETCAPCCSPAVLAERRARD